MEFQNSQEHANVVFYIIIQTNELLRIRCCKHEYLHVVGKLHQENIENNNCWESTDHHVREH